MTANAAPDTVVRLATFRWLTQATDALGDVGPRTLLEQGFEYEGERMR